MNPHVSIEDAELLRTYFRTRDEQPLRALMDRHLPLVYSVALRASGSPELAAEAAQDVFLKLTSKPPSMKTGVPFLAWLHRTARHRAIDLLRSEQARNKRERLAMEAVDNGDDGLSSDALAILDEVLQDLPERDRDLVLQRYFVGHSYAAIALKAGLSEDAVRMRLHRALERMRGLFGARGIATSSALLAGSLPLQAIVQPPSKLVASIHAKVVAGSAAAASQTFIPPLLAIMCSTPKIIAAVAVLAALTIAGGFYHYHSNAGSSVASSFAGPGAGISSAVSSAGLGKSPGSRRPSRSPEVVDKRLLHLVRGDDTGYSIETFRSYLDAEGWKPAAVLACFLLSDTDPQLLGKLDVKSAGPEVLLMLPFLNSNSAMTFTHEDLEKQMRKQGMKNVTLDLLVMRGNFGGDHPEGIREAMLGATSSPDLGLEAVLSSQAEMRKALESIKVTGTEAEILIDQKGISDIRIQSMLTAWMSDAWTQGVKDEYLSAEAKLEFAKACLQVLEKVNLSRDQPRANTMGARMRILRSLPSDTVIDGVPVHQSIPELEARIKDYESYSNEVNEAFLTAEPSTIDEYYSMMKDGRRKEAFELLLQGAR